MAKKTVSTTKPAALNGAAPAALPTPAPAPVAPALVKQVVKPTAKAKPAAKKAKASAVKAKRAPKKAAPKKPSYTRDDVALRAYFISEKRRAHGLSGDEHQDWIEAERQILAEGGKAKKTKSA